MAQNSIGVGSDPLPNAFSRVFDGAIQVATSRIGKITGYFAAVVAAVVAFRQLGTQLNDTPAWIRVNLVLFIFVLPILLLVIQTVAALAERHRKWQLALITGNLQPGYFSLRPREHDLSFTRADGEHHEILRWIERSRGLLYLTGLSGTGKSSLLNSWVLPHLLESQKANIVRLRGYQDPLAALQHELIQPGVIWQKPLTEPSDIRILLERACRHIRPRRLIIVFDQFEEFAILHNPERHRQFAQILSSLRDDPIQDLTLLLILRSDYIGLLQKSHLPSLVQDTNWREVPPFTERAAQEFIQASGLQINEKLLRDVLREAAELEQTKGLIRPITINLCGLVLGRFATGLQGRFRPGALIPGFLRESLLLPELQDVASAIIPHLITSHITKQPRTIVELAESTDLNPEAVLGCLRRLGQTDRSIVRPLDAKQDLWEISHDFLVPLLDSIMARWTISLWKKTLPWLPWITAVSLVFAVALVSFSKSDPIVALTDLGWTVTPTKNGLRLQISGIPPKGSLDALHRIPKAFSIHLDTIDPSISEWRDLRGLASLDLSDTKVSDIGPLKDLKSLTSLDLSDTKVSNVGPLHELKGLTSLSLSQTPVSDVGPLHELKDLYSLSLRGTKVSDVGPLKELKSLTSLSLTQTPVSDVGPLKELKGLTSLYLRQTPVSNVEPLKELKELTSLDLRQTSVNDVGPLRELLNLTSLDLSDTSVSDVTPLRDLKGLTSLYLTRTSVGDIRPLKELKGLISLDLRGTRVSDLVPLKELNRLTSLDLSNTRVNDVAPLRDLKGLTSLYLTRTLVSDAGPLRELKSLTLLDMSGTKVTDVEPLKELKDLTSLDLQGTKVSDLGPLKELKRVISFYLSDTQTSDLRPLKDFKGLTSLDLSGTKVSDLGSLKELQGLISLELRGTPVGDVGPLTELKGLTSLDLSGTKVSDLGPLKELKGLSSLGLRSTPVSDLGPLKELRGLTTLALLGAPVRNLEPLKKLKDLTSLDLSGTRVNDLGPLKELKGLTSLYLTQTSVSDLEPLKELKALTMLDIQDTKVSNVEPLSGLKGLTSLYRSSTPLTNASLGDLQASLPNLRIFPPVRVPPLPTLRRASPASNKSLSTMGAVVAQTVKHKHSPN